MLDACRILCYVSKKGRAARFFLFPSGFRHGGRKPFPGAGFFICYARRAPFSVAGKSVAPFQGVTVEKPHKEALQATKEIIVKFIESGRVSPANFHEIFPSVYAIVLDTLTDSPLPGANRRRGSSDR